MAGLPVELARIHAQFGNADWDHMWQSTHRLHGASASCGVPALRNAVAELEQAIASREPERIASRLGDLQREADRLVVADTPNAPGA
jgi:HPt (histidine-containing phosphotransfer) domain-containing protein